MDLQKIGTTELIKLKNEIVEELHRREMNKTAVIWAIPGEKKNLNQYELNFISDEE